MSIVNGFFEDCQDLIQHCFKLEVLDFQSFCNVWKDLFFPHIYQEITLYGEIGEVSEEFIRVAKYFMLLETGNFKECKIGLYLVYALVTQQPFANFAHLRICASDLKPLKRLEAQIRFESNNDALYILGRVLAKHTRYTAVDRERSFENPHLKYLNTKPCVSVYKTGPIGIFNSQSEETDMLKELGMIGKKYIHYRDRLNGKVDLSMKYVSQDLPTTLMASFKKLLVNSKDDDSDKTELRSDTLAAIKKRAMTNTAQPLHCLKTSLQSTADDKKEKDIQMASTSKFAEKIVNNEYHEKHYTFIHKKSSSHSLKLVEDYATEDTNCDDHTDAKSDTKDRKFKSNKKVNNTSTSLETKAISKIRNKTLKNNKDMIDIWETSQNMSETEENNSNDAKAIVKSSTRSKKQINNNKINDVLMTNQNKSETEENNTITVKPTINSYSNSRKQIHNNAINDNLATNKNKSEMEKNNTITAKPIIKECTISRKQINNKTINDVLAQNKSEIEVNKATAVEIREQSSTNNRKRKNNEDINEVMRMNKSKTIKKNVIVVSESDKDIL